MTNRQWLLNKMQNMSDEELAGMVRIHCTMGCDFCEVKDKSCLDCKIDWMKQKHKEQIKLSDAERVILENIDKDYKWICRDKNMNIYVFDLKPSKDEEYDCWDSDEGIGERLEVFNHIFQFIKWEDEEPYNIEELLEENK